MKSIENHLAPGSKYIRFFFFIAGIVATIAYRITPFLTPLWVKISWYIGTVGFIFYFAHRSHIEKKRADLVREYNLVDVVDKSDILPEEKSAVSYLVKTSLTSKARFNSIFIWVSSAVALVFSLLVDFKIL